MTDVNRRHAIGFGAAAAVAVSTPALALMPKSPLERIKPHTAQLERAMRDHYGATTTTLMFDDKKGCLPCVLVVANTGE
jgi:hypothetical protein